jgi:hypothetical protein
MAMTGAHMLFYTPEADAGVEVLPYEPRHALAIEV